MGIFEAAATVNGWVEGLAFFGSMTGMKAQSVSSSETQTEPNMYSQQSFNDCYTVNWASNLGEGLTGVVRRCTSKQSGQVYAVKFLKDNEVSRQEAQCHWLVRDHDSIATLHEVFAERFKTATDFAPRKYIILIMELVTGGELFYAIKERRRFSEKAASSVMKQLCSAVEYMHKQGVCHRDLKPENILVSGDQNSDSEFLSIKLVDFGFATQDTPKSSVYTANYVAPEVLTSETQKKTTGMYKPYTEKCDVWSIGVIAYILLGGYTPFYSKKPAYAGQLPRDMRLQILNGLFDFPAREFGSVSAEAKSFITRCLVVDASDRMSSEAASSHAWISSNVAPQEAPQEALSSVASEDDNLLFTVHVHVVGKSTTVLDMTCEDRDQTSVEDLKSLVQSEDSSLAAERQRLIVNGKVLTSGKTLGDYHVSAGQTIWLSMRKPKKSEQHDTLPDTKPVATSNQQQHVVVDKNAAEVSLDENLPQQPHNLPQPSQDTPVTIPVIIVKSATPENKVPQSTSGNIHNHVFALPSLDNLKMTAQSTSKRPRVLKVKSEIKARTVLKPMNESRSSLFLKRLVAQTN